MELSLATLLSSFPKNPIFGFPLQWALVSTLLVIVILNSVYKMHFSRAGKLMKKIKGPPNIPLIGITYYAVNINVDEDVNQLTKAVTDKYGPIFGGFVFHQPFVYLTTVKHATVLLRSTELDKNADYFVFRNLIGDGIFLSNGSKWVQRRKLITPSVGLTSLREFTKSFNKQSVILVDILGSEVTDSKKGCDIEPQINRCLLDITFECFVGKDVNAQRERSSEFVEAINGVLDINFERLWKPWKKPDLMWKLCGNEKIEYKFLAVIRIFLEKIIKQERIDREQKPKTKSCNEPRQLLMDILMEKLESGELTEQDLHDEILTMVTAARDTSTRTIIVTLFLLALHPEHQKKVQNEVQELLQNDPEVKIADASQLKYLEACIKESLRLLGVVPFFGRLLKEDLDIGNGIIVPKGASCLIVSGMVHRDPKVYPDPETFRPSRFLDDKQLLDPYAFIGFSAGRRNCPGQKFAMLSVKTIIVHFMKNFDISTSQTMDDVKWTVDLLQKPMTPILFQFNRRTVNLPKCG